MGIVVGGRESRPQGEGPHGSTQLAKETHAGQGWAGHALANLTAGNSQYLHYALNLWFDRVVKPQCRGAAMICVYADDFVCAFQFQDDAERFFRSLPRRLEKFGLEVAPAKTRLLRFNRFHPGMERRFTSLGFELYWFPDRKGVPRVTRRTAPKKLHGACRRIKQWIRLNPNVA